MGSFIASGSQAVNTSRRTTLLRLVFSKMDADQSGVVEMSEFVHIAEEGEYDEVLPQMLNIIDTQYGNADGVLSVDEWVAAMATFHADNTEDELLAQCNQMLATLQKNQRKGWRRLFIKKDAANLVMAARASVRTGGRHPILGRWRQAPHPLLAPYP